MIRQTISSKTSRLVKFAPLLLWLMVILLPVMSAKLIFSSALDIENSLYNSRMRQKMRLELQKYDFSLLPFQFLSGALQRSSCEQLMRDWLDGKAIEEKYNQHGIFGRLPDLSAAPAAIIEQFAQLTRQKTGMRPDIFFVIAEKDQDCFWELKKPFKTPINDDEFRRVLADTWRVMQRRNTYGLKSLPGDLHEFETIPELNQTVGVFQPIKNSYGGIVERFSFLTNDIVYLVNLPIPDFVNSKGHRYIIAGFCRSRFSPQFMLQKMTREYSNSAFTHKVGMSGEDILPAFFEDDQNMTLVGQTPETFSRLAKKIALPEKKQLAISVSCPRQSPETRLKQKLVDFVLNLTVVLSGLLLTAVMLQRISSAASLQKLVKAAFLTGMLLPLAASIWLGICHLNSKRQLETEQMLDYMQHQLALTEQKIMLQQYRSILFQNIFADWAGSLPVSQLRQLNELTGYVSKLTTNKDGLKACKHMARRFYSYFFIHPDIDEDIIGIGASQGQVSESLQPVFLSPTHDILFQLGAYSHLPGEKVRQIVQKSQLTMGLIDVALDRKMLSKVFAEERIPVFNNMTTGREYTTCCFWKNQQGEKTGAIFLQSSRESWKDEMLSLIKDEQLQTVFYTRGYELTLRLYLPNPHRQRILDTDTHEVSARYAPDSRYLWEIAQAMFSVSQTSRVNNLDADQPQLIAGQAVLDGNAYLMAHAVPIPGRSLLSDEAVFAILTLLILLSSYYLAGGVAWVLLRCIPAFQTSMLEIAQQNYLWQIELNSGDEFDKLAHTFNHLTRQLHEKNQISQLVSRNVLDAINSGDDQMLKPGGSRVMATILFADIRGFTTLTEKHPPEMIVNMLNDYFSLMAEQIESQGGIIDKLIGDAIQAVFYHHECENGAEAAVKSGLAMREALSAFNHQRERNRSFTIDNGVG
ncbi:MAG: hypothetical protein ACD_39C01185G0001, partial [uncultured bacterium]